MSGNMQQFRAVLSPGADPLEDMPAIPQLGSPVSHEALAFSVIHMELAQLLKESPYSTSFTYIFPNWVKETDRGAPTVVKQHFERLGFQCRVDYDTDPQPGLKGLAAIAADFYAVCAEWSMDKLVRLTLTRPLPNAA